MIPKVTECEFVFGLDEDTTAWKKAIIPSKNYRGFDYGIIKLTIPKDAKVVLSKHKCRASRAKVEGIYPILPFEPIKPLDINVAYSYFKYPLTFAYEVGKTVHPNRFDLDATNICSFGIHFFRTYKEAADYNFT